MRSAVALARGYKLLFGLQNLDTAHLTRFPLVAHPSFQLASSSSSSASSSSVKVSSAAVPLPKDAFARKLLHAADLRLLPELLGSLFGRAEDSAADVVISNNVDEADDYGGSGGLSMKERLAIFVPQCSKVTERLYLGSEKVAANRELLKSNGITHILNCAGTICLEYFPSDFTYKYYSLVDGKAEDVSCLVYDDIEWIESVLEQPGTRIFIHCQQGISRSSTMLIAYLMWINRSGKGFNEQLMFVKKHRDICNPNQNFQCQLMGYLWKRITQVPPTATRLYRIQPHTIYSPELLVSKEIVLDSSNGASAVAAASSSTSTAADAPTPNVPLDPRGAFVLTTPQGNWIWKGASCESVLVEGARRWVARFQRYEHYPPNTQEVEQSAEPPEFWTALGLSKALVVEPQPSNDHAYGEILALNLEGRSHRDEYRQTLRAQLLSSGMDPTKNDSLSFDKAQSSAAQSSAPSKAKKGSASLYQAPDWELLESFDIDDLDSDNLYCLVVLSASKPLVYVWVGSEYEGRISSKKARSLAKACLEATNSPSDNFKAVLEHDGEESSAFWDFF